MHTTEPALEGNRIRSASEDAFSSAIRWGNGYACSFQISLLSGQYASLKTIHNANTIIRSVEAQGLTVSYNIGSISGDLIQLDGARSLNRRIGDAHAFAIEAYSGQASGDEVFSRFSESRSPYFVDGGSVIGLYNAGDAGSFSVAITFEAETAPLFDTIIYSGTQIESTTEMGYYDGSN